MGTNIRRLTDNADIPNDFKNRDYRKYQKWLAEGNQPKPEFTKAELAAKKISNIKMKEGELVQVKLQYDAAIAEELTIAVDYDFQLKKLRSDLNSLKK